MIYLAILSVFLVALVAWERRQNGLREAAREKEWSLERAALITRIQHPEFVVVPPQEATPDDQIINPELEDDIDLVGTVQANGNGD